MWETSDLGVSMRAISCGMTCVTKEYERVWGDFGHGAVFWDIAVQLRSTVSVYCSIIASQLPTPSRRLRFVASHRLLLGRAPGGATITFKWLHCLLFHKRHEANMTCSQFSIWMLLMPSTSTSCRSGQWPYSNHKVRTLRTKQACVTFEVDAEFFAHR